MIGLRALRVAGTTAPWTALGFSVRPEPLVPGLDIGTTSLDLEPAAAGIIGWTLVGEGPAQLDGLRTTWIDDPGPLRATLHPNGATRLDHVVVMTPSLQRTTGALGDAGLELRRTRDAGTPDRPLQQGFYRLGEVILEVVGDVPPEGPARFWGLVAVVPDVDALAGQLGPRLVGTPKDAVQPGRRILTVRREAGLPVPFAFLTPDPRRG
ncbi:glyoxalase [Conexibacter sp. W3-3-2]|uniref:Glyoxalase n=1 Tax=Paraconexibacter algicola TaxID=2133960 RepID=A0A2T4UCN9_9ACTN|nr:MULTISPECIES: glyoxalase [Solirubrobacterales]MTD43216.1 glyoxalase [Conexibacter sp. W3-3-2]PTL54964.1 glyoxalase [Paraconexibacter algicola]